MRKLEVIMVESGKNLLLPVPPDLAEFEAACYKMSYEELWNWVSSSLRSQEILSPEASPDAIPGGREGLIDFCFGLYALRLVDFPPRAGGGQNNSQRT